jgi:hypothetical protein
MKNEVAHGHAIISYMIYLLWNYYENLVVELSVEAIDIGAIEQQRKECSNKTYLGRFFDGFTKVIYDTDPIKHLQPYE